MPELKHRLTADEATYVRFIERNALGAAPDVDVPTLDARRIWAPRRGGPIRVVAAMSARARCRECGEPIAAGDRVIVFGFQADPWNPGGHVIDAYLHEMPCGAEGGE